MVRKHPIVQFMLTLASLITMFGMSGGYRIALGYHSTSTSVIVVPKQVSSTCEVKILNRVYTFVEPVLGAELHSPVEAGLVYTVYFRTADWWMQIPINLNESAWLPLTGNVQVLGDCNSVPIIGQPGENQPVPTEVPPACEVEISTTIPYYINPEIDSQSLGSLQAGMAYPIINFSTNQWIQVFIDYQNWGWVPFTTATKVRGNCDSVPVLRSPNNTASPYPVNPQECKVEILNSTPYFAGLDPSSPRTGFAPPGAVYSIISVTTDWWMEIALDFHRSAWLPQSANVMVFGECNRVDSTDEMTFSAPVIPGECDVQALNTVPYYADSATGSQIMGSIQPGETYSIVTATPDQWLYIHLNRGISGWLPLSNGLQILGDCEQFTAAWLQSINVPITRHPQGCEIEILNTTPYYADSKTGLPPTGSAQAGAIYSVLAITPDWWVQIPVDLSSVGWLPLSDDFRTRGNCN